MGTSMTDEQHELRNEEALTELRFSKAIDEYIAAYEALLAWDGHQPDGLEFGNFTREQELAYRHLKNRRSR